MPNADPTLPKLEALLRSPQLREKNLTCLQIRVSIAGADGEKPPFKAIIHHSFVSDRRFASKLASALQTKLYLSQMYCNRNFF